MSGETDQAGASDAPVEGGHLRKAGKGARRLLASSAQGSRLVVRTPMKVLRWAQERSLTHALAGQDVAIVYWPDPRSAKVRESGRRLPRGLLVGWHPGVKPLARVDFAATALLAFAGVLVALVLHSLITGALFSYLVWKHVKRWREAVRAAAAKTETDAERERRDKSRPELFALALSVVVILVTFAIAPAMLRTGLILVMVFMGLYSMLANRLDFQVIRADGSFTRVHGVLVRHTPEVGPSDIRFLSAFQWTGTPWGRVTIDTASGQDSELHGWGLTTYPAQWVSILKAVKDKSVESS
jgi:hypothetical protein